MRCSIGVSVAGIVGPELVAGSTRLKAGTAQKLVLNQISTVSMIRLGKVFDNLMVDVVAGNAKLRARARGIVQTVTGVGPDEADEALTASEGSAKVAIVSLLTGLDAAEARDRLGRHRRRHPPCARGSEGAVKLGVAAAVIGDTLVSGDVELDDGHVVRYGVAGSNGRGTAVPGFLDLQVNGFADVDFLRTDGDGYRRAGAALLETGVTSYLPTFISAPEDELVAALEAVPRNGDGPRVLGAHVEGPFLSPRRRGVHPASALLAPDPELLERLLAAGPVRLMTLAPELPGADELIDLLRTRGIAVSIGHSDATAAQAHAAFDHGVRSVTHIFNAMRPLGHRDPGVVGAALARSDVIVCIILDGYHLAAETVALVWRAAAGRVALVTDAVAGAGAADGSYSLGETE